MEKRPFGRTGFEVSVLGFGGAPIGFLKTAQDKAGKVLNTLLDSGVNLIDTAECYPGSEAMIGKSVGHRRAEFVLVTKCGHGAKGNTDKDFSAELIGQTVEQSLKNLKTDRVDVLLLHSCTLDILKKGEALGAAIKARDAGKVRFVGYSGDNEAAAYAASLPDIAVIETSVSICDQVNIDMALPLTQKHNAGVMAKRPIANAAWKKAEDQAGIYADYAKTYSQRLAKMNITPTDLGYEGDPNVTWPQIALRFTLSQPGVHTAIIGTTSPKHVKTNIDAAAQGPLPAAQVEKIRAAFRRAEKKAGQKWTGQT